MKKRMLVFVLLLLVSVVTAAVPTPPAKLRIVSYAGGNVTFAWSHNGQDVARYVGRLWDGRRLVGQCRVQPGEVQQCTFDNLTPRVTYVFRVAAVYRHPQRSPFIWSGPIRYTPLPGHPQSEGGLR